MVCPQRERDLAAVVEVMFNGAPDNPLTREARRLLVLHLYENLVQVGRCPTNESRIHHLPGGLKPTNQLGGTSRRCAWEVPFFHWSQLSTPFAHEQVEIADTATNDMGHIFPNRAEMWSDSQGKLFGRERGNSLNQESLIGIPPFV